MQSNVAEIARDQSLERGLGKMAQSKRSPEELEALSLLRDYFELFIGRKGGNTARHLYSNYSRGPVISSGADGWASVASAPEYDVARQEEECITDPGSLRSISGFFQACKTYVECGPGTSRAVEKKTMPILHACRGLGSTIGIDIVREYAEGYVRVVRSQIPQGLDAYALHGDLFRRRLSDGGPMVITADTPVAAGFWGGTWGNPKMKVEDPFPVEELATSLKKVASIIPTARLQGGPTSRFAFSINTNTDMVRAIRPYSHDAFRSFICGGMMDPWTLSAREHRIHYDPNAWSYRCVINRKAPVMHHGVTAQEQQALTIPLITADLGDIDFSDYDLITRVTTDEEAGLTYVTVDIPKGRFYNLANIARFKIEEALGIVEQAGFKSGPTIQVPNNTAAVLTFEI